MNRSSPAARARGAGLAAQPASLGRVGGKVSRAGVSAGELVSVPAPLKHLATGLLAVFAPRGPAAGEESKDSSKNTCRPWSPQIWRDNFSWPRGPSFLCFGVGSVFSPHCERKVAGSKRHGCC